MMHSLAVLILTSLTMLLWQDTKRQEPPEPQLVVLTIRVEGDAITPVTARFVRRAIEEAVQKQAECLVVFLDTPGGLVESTREIVKDILRSSIPVVVYVAPTGARAASAGVFITMASHVAAMAPGTNIGAAHPIQITGTPLPTRQPQPGAPEDTEGTTPRGTPMEDKIVNDTAAWAQALAELRGRNAEWSVRAVRESISASAREAADAGVVDLLAEDLTDLLRKIQGRQVATTRGTVRLETVSADVQQFDMWWGERLLSTIANPNIAFLLLIFGFYGILFELYSPGWGIAGTVGVISIVLGFFALAVLPTNIVGVALILIAFALFIAEAFVVSYGALTIGGLVCLIMGGLMLVDSPIGFPRVSPSIVFSVAFATAAIAAFLLGNVIRSSRSSVLTGSEAMVETTAIALEDFQPRDEHYEGAVRIHGETWNARSPAPIAANESVKVKDRDGLTLLVWPSQQKAAELEKPTESTKRIA